MKVGNVTIPATGEIRVSASGLYVINARIEAHPSNSAILYIKKFGEPDIGYPLAAGASVDIGRENMYDIAASGTVSSRIAYLAYQ